ncbi:hypothetical protein SLEP1_g30271 [Rubroshorea leprosula]|uniref:Uncharacterized protein n=1 Tax=Rubroshorea leprosula TaxID=152421 RepID=A0AAV5K5A1_9ROSI|nr:hypothetical protein SLEP1_g30271 [Rubroshorea leprosula]
MLMENFLWSIEYWTIVEAGVPEPTTGANDAHRAEIEKEKLKDLKAKNYLFQAIDWAILETILNKSTSKNIWDSMKKKMMAIANKMRIHGENLEDVAIVVRPEMEESKGSDELESYLLVFGVYFTLVLRRDNKEGRSWQLWERSTSDPTAKGHGGQREGDGWKIKESKVEMMDHQFCRKLWGSENFDWVAKPSKGASSG